MSNTSMNTSGDGTRPSTSGGVDNMGASSTFTPHKKPAPGQSPEIAGASNSPNPVEKMTEKRQDGAADDAHNPGPRKDGE